jgi:hypothetical protein
LFPVVFLGVVVEGVAAQLSDYGSGVTAGLWEWYHQHGYEQILVGK